MNESSNNIGQCVSREWREQNNSHLKMDKLKLDNSKLTTSAFELDSSTYSTVELDSSRFCALELDNFTFSALELDSSKFRNFDDFNANDKI